jgi:acetyl esterase
MQDTALTQQDSNHVDLDPEIREFVDSMSAGWKQHPPLDQLPLSEARAVAEKVRSPWTKGGPTMRQVSDLLVPMDQGDVRVRIFDPDDTETKPALIYLHGGGWTVFSIDTHDRIMREYAGRTGMAVVGVDYSLSPEVRFPRALDETLAVVRWAHQHGNQYRIDPNRIALGGDSAGACMTVAACIQLRDEHQPHMVKSMLLNYGAYDATCANESYELYGHGGYMWSPGEMAGYWKNYLGDTPMTDPLACPTHADVRSLPPAFSVIPDCDVMFEESMSMAEKLRRAGVMSNVAIYAGATHSFLEAVSVARISDRAFADASRWLVDTLSGP